MGNPVSDKPTSRFSKDMIFTGAKLTQEKHPAAVRITAHQYIKSEEVETLLDGVKVIGAAVFTFSEPHWGYNWNEAPQGAYVKTYDNWVRITTDYDWVITLTGKKYNHITQDRSWTNADATLLEKGNVVKVESATLITPSNATAALARLKAYHRLNNVLSETAVISGQKAGDMVESINPWGEPLTAGYITSMESEFTANGHTASVTIRGVYVPADEAEVVTV